MNVVRCLFVLLLAFSSTAMAQAVRVTSQLSGDFLYPNPIVLGHIGHGDYFDFTGDSMPFALTVSALIDPKDPLTFGGADQVHAYAADVAVTLVMGGATSHFRDLGATARLSTGPSGYRMQVSFPYSFYIASFTTWLQGPAGSFTGLALAPQDIRLASGMRGGAEIMTYPPHLDMDGRWSMSSFAGAGSLQVVSAVPEPANPAMLCAGLLALAFAGRAIKKAARRLPPCTADADAA